MELYLEPLSVGDLVRGVESVMHGIAARRRIDLAVELDPDLPPIVADPPRVKQVLYNLVSNAVKFSPDGATVLDPRPLPGRRGLAARRRGRRARGRGPRHRHPQRGPAAHLRGVPAGRRPDDPQHGRHGPRPRAGQALRRDARRQGRSRARRSAGAASSASSCRSTPRALRRAARPASRSPSASRFEEARTAVERAGLPLVLVAEDDDAFFAGVAAELEARRLPGPARGARRRGARAGALRAARGDRARPRPAGARRLGGAQGAQGGPGDRRHPGPHRAASSPTRTSAWRSAPTTTS